MSDQRYDSGCAKLMEVRKAMSHHKSLLFIPLLVFFWEPSFLAAQVSWVKNLDDALRRAAMEKKCVVLDISASW